MPLLRCRWLALVPVAGTMFLFGSSAQGRKIPPVGPDAGVFLPSSGLTRDRFGDAWVSLGLGFGKVPTSSQRGRIDADVSLLSNKRGDNRAYVAPVGVGYRIALGPPGTVTPYVGLSADAYLTYLRAPQDGVTWGVRTGGGGSAFAGLTFGKRGFLEARYRAASKIRGYDFSGVDLRAGLRF